jgi:hypothetical protein
MTGELPRVATWLFDTFASGPSHESVAGDIAERFRAGRSRVWYGRQVLAAILLAVLNEIRTHTFRAIRAVAVGWSLTFIVLWDFQALFDLHSGIGILPASWTRPPVVSFHGWLVPGFATYFALFLFCVLGFGLGSLMGLIYPPKIILLFVSTWVAVLAYVFCLKVLPHWLSPEWAFVAVVWMGHALTIVCTLAGGVWSDRGLRLADANQSAS